MKKYLLLSAAACLATASFAQVEKTPVQKFNRLNASPLQMFERATKNNVAKSYSNQTYYLPEGTYYGGWDVNGTGAGYCILLAAPFSDITYKNMCTNPTSTSWTLNGTDVTQYYATADGDMKISYGPNFMAYIPALINGQITYQFGENGVYYLRGSITDINQAALVMTGNTLTFSDAGEVKVPFYAMNDHGSREQNGQTYGNVIQGYGFLNGTAFLFGSGTVTDNDNNTSTATGCYQIFNAPAADLYIEDIFSNALTFNDNGPIPAGEKLTAYIASIDTVASEDGVRYRLGDEVIASLAATSETVTGFTYDSDHMMTNWTASGAYAGKNPTTGTVVFYNTDVDKDPLTGAESPKPIVIPAGKAFAVVISGLDNNKINIGFPAIISNEEDNGVRGVVMTEGGNYSYSNKLGMPIALEGAFEKIHIQPKEFLSAESQSDFPTSKFNGWNVLRVSNDGNTVATDGLSGTNYALNGVFVGTATSWVDENDAPNYSYEVEYLSGGEDWITELNYNTDYYENSNENISTGLNGYNVVAPVCQALPAGVSGRAAKITFYGRGDVKSDNPIYVLQGDADYATAGINNAIVTEKKANMNNRIYNLAGQQVSKDYKGLVIKNGAKVLVK